MGCGVAVMLPLAMIALLVLSFLTGDDEAEASHGIRGMNCAPAGTSRSQMGPWGVAQMGNASVIVGVGLRRGIPEQGIVIALMAAMTESGLQNLDHGDRDSLGLFQMRPSQGWGTPAQLTDPDYASNKFYDVLLAVPNWQSLTPGAAAQAVERSARPDRYDQYEQQARQVFGAVRDVRCLDLGGGAGERVSLPDNPKAETVINAALSQLGVRYAWGGGTPAGPSAGTGVDAGIVGFDCSGLALYAYAAIGVAVPHQTQAIWNAFQPAITNRADLQPGDLILLSDNGKPGGIHHVAIYLGGDGRAVHAPQSGDVVKTVDHIWESSYWTSQFIGAVRPGVT